MGSIDGLAADTGDAYRLLSHDESETQAIGRAVADALAPGNVVALVGPLGAGKTRLVQSIAVALGVDPAEVRSPTFVLIQEYRGRMPIHHFDTYRLRDVDEFLALGAEEIFESGGVCLIEWADRVRDVLPADRLWIDIEIAGPSLREFQITAAGPNSRAIVERLRALA